MLFEVETHNSFHFNRGAKGAKFPMISCFQDRTEVEKRFFPSHYEGSCLVLAAAHRPSWNWSPDQELLLILVTLVFAAICHVLREMEASSSENGRNDGNSKARSLEKRVVVNEVGGGGEEDEETLKTRILEHPLYGLLIETHMECLKVGLGETEEADRINAEKQTSLELQTNPSSSELDVFMEAYCVALGKLKEAMEEPLQETASFIKAMYEQLEELSDNHPNTPGPSSK